MIYCSARYHSPIFPCNGTIWVLDEDRQLLEDDDPCDKPSYRCLRTNDYYHVDNSHQVWTTDNNGSRCYVGCSAAKDQHRGLYELNEA